MKLNNIFTQNIYYSLPAESRRKLSMTSTNYRNLYNTNTQRNRLRILQLVDELRRLSNQIKEKQKDLNGLKRGNNWSIFKRYEGINESERSYYTKNKNGKQEMRDEVELIKRNAEISEIIENDSEYLKSLKNRYNKKLNSAMGLYYRLQRVDPTFIIVNPSSLATANKKKSGSKAGKGGKGFRDSKGGKGSGRGLQTKSTKSYKGGKGKGKGRGRSGYSPSSLLS
tara:strand:+ start:1159 stop:1833 length:675 start_codon:yes stop_codon:yes gene_type:complete